jgi:AcrR family transcriptional regulator
MPSDTKQRILAVAEELFARKGLEGTTIAEIADTVGMRAPGVYRHFPNKRAIYDAVLDDLMTPFTNMVDDLASLDGSNTPIEEFLTPIVNRYLERPYLARIILQATLAEGEQLQEMTQRWFIPIFEKVNALLPGDTPDTTPSAIINFHSLMLGYLSLAPFHERIFGVNPLAPGEIEQHLHTQAILADGLKNSSI